MDTFIETIRTDTGSAEEAWAELSTLFAGYASIDPALDYLPQNAVLQVPVEQPMAHRDALRRAPKLASPHKNAVTAIPLRRDIPEVREEVSITLPGEPKNWEFIDAIERKFGADRVEKILGLTRRKHFSAPRISSAVAQRTVYDLREERDLGLVRIKVMDAEGRMRHTDAYPTLAAAQGAAKAILSGEVTSDFYAQGSRIVIQPRQVDEDGAHAFVVQRDVESTTVTCGVTLRSDDPDRDTIVGWMFTGRKARR